MSIHLKKMTTQDGRSSQIYYQVLPDLLRLHHLLLSRFHQQLISSILNTISSHLISSHLLPSTVKVTPSNSHVHKVQQVK
ncbi:uncharacterized protein ARB_02711 [Trichophyton benhamiae CBS 112371]|uniref:Uncharacterized protein n=1 Tax=Arthroderma benhamiae (strain ATCC MYA-4681 / CBS 112371) TaxID=663331 RepID=D4B2M8_ARTBC|nr:uncharacterized protein ARB_02711 [Trichophyton benhamiae CBS 112371]EFE30339.1 hypothetical protein ARB_02711 [Trichophyton benhamiae CBS 112371]